MSSDPGGASSPPARRTPAEKLIFNVVELCRRCARGRAAARNWAVRCNRALRIASILLSSLGGVGVIVEKASTNLPGESGWTFWGSVVLLAFGILSQVANEFEIAKRAADARSLAEKCDVYDTRLEYVLTDDDPRTDVASMLVEVNDLFVTEQYNKVLPRMTLPVEQDPIEKVAEARASYLIKRNRGHWQLPERKQKGVVVPPKGRPPVASSPPGAAPEPPTGPSGDKSHGS